MKPGFEACRIPGRAPGRTGEAGQTTTEYVTILGMITLAMIAMLGTLGLFARIAGNLVRRLVVDLSS